MIYSQQMIIYLVADYGAGDLAWSEVRQSLQKHFPDFSMQEVAVPAFDTHAAGFCLAQLALRAGPEDIIYHNVAPRRESGSDPEPLLAMQNSAGALLAGPGSGASWSLVQSKESSMVQLLPPENASQFRSRDFFPAAISEAWEKLRAGQPFGENSSFVPPSIDPGTVLYTDGYGNIKTSWTSAPGKPGSKVILSVRGKRIPIFIADGAFARPEGELTLLPGSSGLPESPLWEIFLRGGSAAKALDFPAGGTSLLPS